MGTYCTRAQRFDDGALVLLIFSDRAKSRVTLCARVIVDGQLFSSNKPARTYVHYLCRIILLLCRRNRFTNTLGRLELNLRI